MLINIDCSLEHTSFLKTIQHVVSVQISYHYLKCNINSEDVLHVFLCLSKADKVIKKDKLLGISKINKTQ